MKRYTLAKETTARMVKQRIAMLCCLVMVIIVAQFWLDPKRPNAISFFVFVGGLMLIVAAVSLFMIRKRLKKNWAKFEVALDAERIVKKQAGLAEMEIAKDEVVAIYENKNGDLIVTTEQPQKAMLVPCGLEGFAAVREQLAAWRVIRPQEMDVRRLLYRQWGLIGLMLLSMLLTWHSHNPYIVVPSGLLAVGIMLYSLWQEQRNPYTKRKKAQQFWTFWIVLMILLKMVSTCIS